MRYWYAMKLEEGWSSWRECTRQQYYHFKDRWDYAVDVTEDKDD